MKSRTFATFAECADHLQLRGYTHLSWEGEDTRLDDHHERTSGGPSWRWRYRDGGAYVWAISGLGKKYPFGRPVRLEAPTEGEYTTVQECVRRLRLQGYTHAAGVDDAGVEVGRPIPLGSWLGIKDSDPVRYRLEGADMRCRDNPSCVMAHAVRITSAWEWLVHDTWLEPTPAGEDRPFGFLEARGYSVRDYCAICGASLVGAAEADHAASFDNERRVVHVLEQACVARVGGMVAVRGAAELTAMPRPVPPARLPTSWDRLLADAM